MMVPMLRLIISAPRVHLSFTISSSFVPRRRASPTRRHVDDDVAAIPDHLRVLLEVGVRIRRRPPGLRVLRVKMHDRGPRLPAPKGLLSYLLG